MSLSNYAYVNVVYPSSCDTTGTVDLYVQAYKLIKSVLNLNCRILYWFLQKFLGEDPQTPFQ